jgi:DNA-binding transcriptional LysR family regulator
VELSSQMILFAQVVESGSFSAAARKADHTHSAVSKQIGLLEDRLGVRLLNRTQSGISLTEAGAAFYDKCVEVAEKVAEAEAAVQEATGSPRGELKVAATVAFAKSQVLPLLNEFLLRHPEIRISMELTDRETDLGSGAADVAIQFTEQVHGANIVVRKLASNRRILVAAPGYLANFGMIDRPEDLARANCLRLSTVARWNAWSIADAAGRPVDIDGNFVADSADGVYHAALAGIGVARLSKYLVNGDLLTGRLRRVLPEYESADSDLFVLYADRRNLLPRIRAFVDFLAEKLGPVPPWER